MSLERQHATCNHSAMDDEQQPCSQNNRHDFIIVVCALLPQSPPEHRLLLTLELVETHSGSAKGQCSDGVYLCCAERTGTPRTWRGMSAAHHPSITLVRPGVTVRR